MANGPNLHHRIPQCQHLPRQMVHHIQNMVNHIQNLNMGSNDLMDTINHSTVHPTIPSSQAYDRRYGMKSADRDLVEGYTELVTDRIKDGWSCNLLTILFTQLPGPRRVVIDQMRDEVQWVYSTFITRVHRKPRAASPDELPVLIGAADLPVYKRDRSSSPVCLCNGGLHFHAVLLVPPTSRLRIPVGEHFAANEELYRGKSAAVAGLHVRSVTHGYHRVVDYVFKTVLRGRISYDDGVLLLPRASRELLSHSLASSSIPRDSSMNVSGAFTR